MKTMNPQIPVTNDHVLDEESKAKQKGIIIPLSPADKLIYHGQPQRELFALYGDPRTKGWANKWMDLWHIQQEFRWFPAERIYIHKEFRSILTTAFYFLETDGLHKEIKTFDGCYNVRLVRGSNALLSIHSWGCAIDLNAQLNPLGAQSDWSYDFIAVMERCGIFCGSRWPGRPDPMHFALVNG